MKNAAILVGIWVGIILIAYAVATMRGGGFTRVTLAGDTQVSDESSGFSFPLPVGWSTRTVRGATAIDAPVPGVEAWALSVPGTDVETALAAAWGVLDPCSSCSRPTVLATTPLADGRNGSSVDLGADAEGKTAKAIVLLRGETARVLLVQLSPGAALPDRVVEDLRRMEAGFQETAVALPASAVAPIRSATRWM